MKRFTIEFDTNYYVMDDKHNIVTMASIQYFNGTRGYTLEDVMDLESVKIGGSIKLDNGHQTITRTE